MSSVKWKPGNNLRHSSRNPGEAARRAAEASKNIVPQTPEDKARTDAQVLEGKLHAFGTLEAYERHQVLCQLALPRMLVYIEVLPVENLAEAEAEVMRWVNEQQV